MTYRNTINLAYISRSTTLAAWKMSDINCECLTCTGVQTRISDVSDSDTMYEPNEDDYIELTTDSELSLVSEDSFNADVPPLQMSEIENMPKFFSKEGSECCVCSDLKENFINFVCCAQLICKDCTIQEWLI